MKTLFKYLEKILNPHALYIRYMDLAKKQLEVREEELKSNEIWFNQKVQNELEIRMFHHDNKLKVLDDGIIRELWSLYHETNRNVFDINKNKEMQNIVNKELIDCSYEETKSIIWELRRIIHHYQLLNKTLDTQIENFINLKNVSNN